MQGIIIVVIAVIMLPTILIVLMPLIDKILTVEVIEQINITVGYIEQLIGSTNTNILFALIGLIIIMPIIRRFYSFFGQFNTTN